MYTLTTANEVHTLTGETLEDLVARSDQLGSQSKRFYVQAKKVCRCKMTSFFIVFISVFLPQQNSCCVIM